jgi:threonylcarbamoyladenosine tRNA methylthiotransferase MtaB
VNARRPTTLFLYTLGCKVNWCDSEALAAEAERRGWERVADVRAAAVAVVNTCTVTTHADATARKLIRQIRRRRPDLYLAVVGCYARANAAALDAMPEVDLTLPTHDAATIMTRLDRWRDTQGKVPNLRTCEHADFSSSELPEPGRPFERTRRFIKVQDGCARFCAYCRVPLARGAPRSVPLADVQDAVRRAADEGYREIVLTGIHLAGYRSDDLDVAGLAERILALDLVPRVRISSLDATAIDDRLLALLADAPALMPHLHIPLQSGSETVLRRMRRATSSAMFETAVTRVLSCHPLAAVSTDIMVGFPGERAVDFAATLALVDRVPFLKVHMFRFSPRPGTAAARMQDDFVPPIVAREREDELREHAAAAAERCRAQFAGATMHVLLEQEQDGEREGLAENYLRVGSRQPGLTPGMIVALNMAESHNRFLPLV